MFSEIKKNHICSEYQLNDTKKNKENNFADNY